MKRILLLVACFAFVNDVDAQRNQHIFFVGGGFGLSSLQYQIKDGNHQSGLGGKASIGYSFMVSPQMGLSTGIGLSFYSAQCDMNVLSSEQPAIGIDGDFIFKASYSNYHETQKATYLNIPVMALFKTESTTAFYGMAGVKIGFPVDAKYKGSGNLTTSAFFEFENQEYQNMPEFGFGSFDDVGGNAKLDLDMNLSLSIEAGIECSISYNWALRAGVFLDYGFMDIRKGNKNQPLVKYQNVSSSNLVYNSMFQTQHIEKATNVFAGIKIDVVVKF